MGVALEALRPANDLVVGRARPRLVTQDNVPDAFEIDRLPASFCDDESFRASFEGLRVSVQLKVLKA